MFAFALFTAGAVGLRAEENKVNPNAPLQDKTSEALGKLDPILKASNWETALVMLKTIVAEAPPNTRDKALSSFILAQVYLQHAQTKGLEKSVVSADYAAAIPLFDYVIGSGFYEDKKIDFYFIQAQLYMQGGNTAKAEETARLWFAKSPKPTQEGLIFLSTITYQRGVADPKKIDVKAMEEVVSLADRAMRLFIKPMENIYLLKAVALQSIERLQEASEVFEQMVMANPKNGQYWAQLFAVYANLNMPMRAAITIERAQSQGLMSSPKENLTLATLYYNMDRLEKAITLLKDGLRDGKIEAERTTYELLGFALQRLYRELEAIEVYKEASKHFKTGQFDYTIATLYYALNQYPDALKYAEVALSKGELEGEYPALMFTTYVAYELKDYTKAMKYVVKAEALAKNDKDREQTNGLKKAVQDQLTMLENARKAEAPAPAAATP